MLNLSLQEDCRECFVVGVMCEWELSCRKRIFTLTWLTNVLYTVFFSESESTFSVSVHKKLKTKATNPVIDSYCLCCNRKQLLVSLINVNI